MDLRRALQKKFKFSNLNLVMKMGSKNGKVCLLISSLHCTFLFLFLCLFCKPLFIPRHGTNFDRRILALVSVFSFAQFMFLSTDRYLLST